MKILILGFLITAALAASAGAQTKAPDQAAKEFYKWYLTELNAERYPIRQNKPRMLRAVSKRLGQWIYSPAYSEYGADYFIDAQDWEWTWVSGISATRPHRKGDDCDAKHKARTRQRCLFRLWPPDTRREDGQRSWLMEDRQH